MLNCWKGDTPQPHNVGGSECLLLPLNSPGLHEAVHLPVGSGEGLVNLASRVEPAPVCQAWFQLWEADVSLDDTSSLFKDVPPELLPTICICLPLARNESHGST